MSKQASQKGKRKDPSVTTRPISYRIADFVQWNNRDELRLSPEFQRRPVWLSKARSYLIDTIVRGLPVPPIYVREIIDPKTQRVTREVIDGQQRLRAVLDFIAGNLRIGKAHNAALAGKSFRNLDPEEQTKFLQYPFSVNLVEQASYEDILDIFARINAYTMTLKRQEKLNALYFGEFKASIYKLGRENASFWKDCGVLTDRQIARMAEAEMASELLVAMIDGLQDKKKSLEKFYRKYDDEFAQRHELETRFRFTIGLIKKIVGADLRRLAFRRRPLFYSLFCVMYDLHYGLPKVKEPTQHIPRKKYDAVKAVLVKLSGVVNSKIPDQGYLDFIEACARQTDNLKPRQVRHTTMKREILASLA